MPQARFDAGAGSALVGGADSRLLFEISPTMCRTGCADPRCARECRAPASTTRLIDHTAYNLPISPGSAWVSRCESLPWRQSSLADQPNDPPRSVRPERLLGSHAGGGPIAGPSRQHGRAARRGGPWGHFKSSHSVKRVTLRLFTLMYARGSCQAPPKPENVRDSGRLGDRKHRPRGGLATGLETLRRTCAPNMPRAAPPDAPSAHPPARSTCTPVPAREG